MLSIEEMQYNPTSEALVKILCKKTQSDNPLFFRVLVGYFFSMVASMMRVTIATHDRGDIPVNMYALNLSPSGTGKGHSTNILESNLIHLFRGRFLQETLPLLAEDNLPKLSLKRSQRKGTDPDVELEKTIKEFNSLGSLAFSFDSGSVPAIKQQRQILLMADAGSLNLQIDEVGLNFVSNMDALKAFLELYDVGLIKQKVTKDSATSTRNEEIVGRTPSNLMLFGTPSKLLDGGKTEEELYSMLDTGYARRCFFGYMRTSPKNHKQTPEEIYNSLVTGADDQYLEAMANNLEMLADMINVNKKLTMTKDTSLILIEYRLKCEKEAETYPNHADMRKAEICHRYYKALKLAGAYAFIDNSVELTTAHLYQAIKLAEESGEAFARLLTRDRPYVKLAKYIANVQQDVTQADLVEDLPFYRGGMAQKAEMLTLAIAYGYKNNIVIKKAFSDGIEFLRGETLKMTDLNKMVIAYSTDYTTDYQNETAPFDQLHKLTQVDGMHWVTHHLNGGYRNEENCIPGFNLVVIDVDDGKTTPKLVKALLGKYSYLLYTTKRHTEEEPRFRIIFPINYILALDAKDYKEFVSNIYEWLPFSVDTGTNQRARKWLSHDGSYEYNEGDLLDALPFIPKTSKNEARKIMLNSQQSMNNLERWVINNSGDGNRNNMLLRYALLLVDSGMSFENICSRVLNLNNSLPDKLDEAEIMGTIVISVGKAISKK